jgi:uncharacterized protein YjbJ (UPF0337 family)
MARDDVFRGMWMQLRGEARMRWGKLTDSELDQVKGERDKLLGLLQRKYGYARDKADREIDELLHKLRVPSK